MTEILWKKGDTFFVKCPKCEAKYYITPHDEDWNIAVSGKGFMRFDCQCGHEIKGTRETVYQMTFE